MNADFHKNVRSRLYASLPSGSLTAIFSGVEVRKTNDEFYPFFADRNFVYLTGLECKEAILLAAKDSDDSVWERLYILPPDAMAERWTGKRIRPSKAEELSGIQDIRYVTSFESDLHRLATSGNYDSLYLDLYRCEPSDRDRPAQLCLKKAQKEYPFLSIGNANTRIRALRTIKQPCEIDALREAEKITREGILAMMRSSRPGMYEYQYKAEFDRAIGQFGPQGPGFPSIISAGENNFCIHYYEYTGQAKDGDMVLNDVGATYNNLITDVSRAWPCNGRFSDRQKLLFNCALATSDYMFSIIRPGMKMADVDATIRRYNYERLKDAGVLDSFDEIGTYMWHGGAHHIGFDVHDAILLPETISPGMVFCIDVGIYHEEWGIGFRLEDNCLVTENGCENLSAAIPRTVEDIEAFMGKR
ncbi:MAG: aminopeptidase P N-terminal domain-containing protein [Fusicatenibacter sp.]|nr:aminopeptidase P N-terminal domain-containing protein [Lachnospiraceae bacterium]MDY2939033.1 aminopeptidase P N-terminal domain-containing protein [Fusicatenibacter sp.]